MILGEMISTVFKYASVSVAVLIGLYASFLGLIVTPAFQAHIVYLHKIQMTWFKDLNVPENFGFLRNQATPFSLKTSDGERLYAWHILPVELYRKHESSLLAEPSGFVSDITSTFAFQLLRDDPDARWSFIFTAPPGPLDRATEFPIIVPCLLDSLARFMS